MQTLFRDIIYFVSFPLLDPGHYAGESVTFPVSSGVDSAVVDCGFLCFVPTMPIPCKNTITINSPLYVMSTLRLIAVI
jgi:hypothetical protein